MWNENAKGRRAKVHNGSMSAKPYFKKRTIAREL
jgi:hypothetical protein